MAFDIGMAPSINQFAIWDPDLFTFLRMRISGVYIKVSGDHVLSFSSEAPLTLYFGKRVFCCSYFPAEI